jgi:hypothetical protein
MGLSLGLGLDLGGRGGRTGGGAAGPLLIVIAGESNSGGYAPNASATAGELAARPELNWWNVTSEVFEPLNIGTNNNMDHAGLDSTTHGIELELANAIAAGRFGSRDVYAVQTGQGGSNIQDFLVGSATGFWTKFLDRVGAAIPAIPTTPEIVVFYSQGINDAVGNNLYGGAGATTDPATWKTRTLAHHAKIRAELGADVRIVMTTFRAISTYNPFNTRILEIAAESGGLTTVIGTPDNTGVEWQNDGNHWSYLGYKTLCQRFIDAVLLPTGQTAEPSFAPAAGTYESTQTVTISGGGSYQYSLDTRDPWIGTPYTTPFAVDPPLTVYARAWQPRKAASGIVSVQYLGGTTWSTTDATAGSFTLTNGNRDVQAGQTMWQTVRATKSQSAGKWYVEYHPITNVQFGMIGFADSGFVATGGGQYYLGTSNYSVGLSTGGVQYLSSGFSAGSGAVPESLLDVGEVWQLAIDFTDGKIWLGKDNTWLGSGDPAAGSNPAVNFTPATVGALFPGVSQFGVTEGGKVRIAATTSQQTYTPPSGFTAWG